MKRALALLFLVVGACTPDIPQNPPPPARVVAAFDPGNAAGAIVPTPNDLALASGTVVVPVPQGCPGASSPVISDAGANFVPLPAQTSPPATASDGVKDGDETDVDCGGSSQKACDAGKMCLVYQDCASGNCINGACVGGCPSPAQREFDSEYLGSLSGFPFETTAQAIVTGDLDPSTVNPTSVLVLDITSGSPVPVSGAVVSYSTSTRVISVAPPSGGWTRANRYAIALLAGTGGLQGKNGESVIGSPAWALVSNPKPLVTCSDAADLNAALAGQESALANCKPTVDILPSNLTDPAARLLQQTAEAIQLEKIRLIYTQILGGLPTDVVLLWTFTIVDAGEVTFDPANSVIPFPNDILRGPETLADGGATGPMVQLPNPTTGMPLTVMDCATTTDSQVQLVCGLNMLDGFSTLVAPISENSDPEGALQQGSIDGTTLTTTNAGLVKLTSNAPLPEQTTPEFTPCLNCVSSKTANGTPQTSPQQLQWSLQAPLDEKTTYLGYVTTAVKDTTGKGVIANPIFALVRSQNSLLTSDMTSAVTVLTDAQANQLEALRVALAPAINTLAQGGTTRGSLALAWAFTTQSEASLLDQLAAFPAMAAATTGLPAVPLALTDVTTAYKTVAAAGMVPVTNVGEFFAGVMLSLDLATGPSGMFNPEPTQAKPLPIDFLVAVPSSAPPATGYPIAIFGHGLGRSRNDLVPIANALTGAGFLVIATDTYFHGDRTSCTGSSAATASMIPANASPSDDYACNHPAAAGGYETCDENPYDGLCILTGMGTRDPCTYGAFDATGDAGCAAKGEGRCAADGKCQGIIGAPVACTAATSDAANAICAGDGLGICDPTTNVCTGSTADLTRAADGTPTLSGWNFLDVGNFFTTRDNFRQQVIDLSQLILLIDGTSTQPAPNLNAGLQALFASQTPIIDVHDVDYVGQSLGGILGTLFNAVSPTTTDVVLNVPGGNLTTLFLESPDLATERAVLIQTLMAGGIDQGTPAFDRFIGLAQWILDPADPSNMGYRLTHGLDPGTGVVTPNANRKAFIQFIQDDQFVVNDSTLALIAGANRTFDPTASPSYGCIAPLFCYEFTETGDGFNTTALPLAARHGFLLDFTDPTVTAAAQTQVTTFLTTGSAP